jgi:hypothetical protein
LAGLCAGGAHRALPALISLSAVLKNNADAKANQGLGDDQVTIDILDQMTFNACLVGKLSRPVSDPTSGCAT